MLHYGVWININLVTILDCLCFSFRLQQRWIEVNVDTQVDTLIDSVNNGLNNKSNASPGIIRTMVFANTVEAVEAIARVLSGAGIDCFHYHSDSSIVERTNNLISFQQEGGVFVCTDSAARGLDIPNVSHVIQVRLKLFNKNPIVVHP